MRGHQNYRHAIQKRANLRRNWTLQHQLERVDTGVSGYMNSIAGDAFIDQVLPGVLRGRKMKVRQQTHNPAVDLFGKRLPFVISAQTGLDVRDPQAGMKSRQSRSGSSSRITLN